MPELPTGTVTLLFASVAGLAALQEQDARAAPEALARQAQIVRAACEAHQGHVFKAGDGALSAVFARPVDALRAALDAQATLLGQAWPAGLRPRVRMALHAGNAQARGGDYFGPAVHHTQCLLSACHGDQVLLSSAAAEQLRGGLPDGVSLRDLGERRLRDLSRPERIFHAVAHGLPEAFPLPRTLDNPPGNLPEPSGGLVGRAQEVAALRGLLRRPGVRMVTLTGAAGAGKTRLALQVGALLLDEFASGVFFVALAPAREPERAVSAIARVLGVKENGGRPLRESLAEYLKPRELLLVLDNLEQVMPAAPYVAELLAAAPWLRVLATSRAPTHLATEHTFAVPPLALPDLKRLPPAAILARSAAIQLFAVRAQAVQPGFVVDNGNARLIAEICVRLDGLPLALELAAARVAAMPLPAMLAQLTGGASAALEMLAGGSPNAPERQQALRSAIDWSYALLAPAEQQLFARLSVFVGGATLEAIAAVQSQDSEADPELESILSMLIDKSMLQRWNGRYTLLETLREYAIERLEASGEAGVLRRRHAECYLALAQTATEQLTGAEQRAWLERLEVDHDNLRAALAWSLAAGLPELALHICAALWRFWVMHGYLTEGRQWLREALAQAPGAGTGLRAQAFNGAGVLAWRQGDLAEATAALEEALTLRRQMGDEAGMASSLNNLGVIAYDQGNYDRAQAMYEASLALFRGIGQDWGVANGLNNLGQVARSRRDYAGAAELYHESLACWRAMGYQGGVAMALSNLGHVAHSQGDEPSALACFEEGLALRRELGDRQGVAECTAGLAAVAAGLGDCARAARLCGAVHALLAAVDGSLESLERATYEETIAIARAALGESSFAAEWEAGRNLEARG